MPHRVVIIGSGYAGLATARRLAGGGVRVTVVSPQSFYVERVRLHEVAAGVRAPSHARASLRGVTWVTGTVQAIDRTAKMLAVAGPELLPPLTYDTLVIAAGSSAHFPNLPGVEHAAAVGDWARAQELRSRLPQLAHGSHVTVVGAGLTGVETAAELAEAFPAMRVRLVSAGPAGRWLAPRAASHLVAALRDVHVDLTEGTRVEAITATSIVTSDGELPSALSIFATGFQPSPLAASSGLAVASDGRMLVDSHLVSISDPNILGVGDAAVPEQALIGIRMSCQTAIPMGWHAARTIRARLRGVEPPRFRMRYVWTNTSVGRHDGLTQITHADDLPTKWWWSGRRAAHFKELITRSAATVSRGRVPRAL